VAYLIIRADRSHIDWIIHHRLEMFKSMGWSAEDLLLTEEVTRNFLETEWKDNPEVLVAIEDGEIVGGVAINYSARLPSNRNLTGKSAYIMNMYVELNHRNKGIASQLMQKSLEVCHDRGVGKVSLHATDMGESVYTKLGFIKSENFYQLYLKWNGEKRME